MRESGAHDPPNVAESRGRIPILFITGRSRAAVLT